MQSMMEVKRRQREIFGLQDMDYLLIDKPSLLRATEEIENQLKVSQTARIENSKRLMNIKKSTKHLMDLNTIEETETKLDYIGKLQRLNKKT